jgi:fructosamine-3-kinase
MWRAIEQAINTETGDNFHISEKTPVSGGDINLSYQVSDSNSRYFVKINDKNHFEHFESEAYALEQINALNQVSCPDVIAVGTTLDKSYLVLNYIPLENGTNHQWHELGQQLANMHKSSSHGQFGWQTDNFIGDTIQPNMWSSNWKTFFAEQRIAWQLQLLHEKSIKLGNIDHITQVCHDVLKHHHVEPCLVHGDLWQGNLGFTESSSIIFDPACYYGDREVDIAMTELFGHLPIEFYRGYQEIFPLPDSYEQRKIIYNFYHILNHANLFGGNYIDQSKAILTRIMSLPLH